jgi:hypothetical protein
MKWLGLTVALILVAGRAEGQAETIAVVPINGDVVSPAFQIDPAYRPVTTTRPFVQIVGAFRIQASERLHVVEGYSVGFLPVTSIARIPLRLRRGIARLTGLRWVPFDPVLRDREAEPARREAWLRDQYAHPEEHRHSVGEVRRWFAEEGLEWLRTYPSTIAGDEPDDLFTPAADHWPLEARMAQLGWMRSLGGEGGLFVTVGRRPG